MGPSHVDVTGWKWSLASGSLECKAIKKLHLLIEVKRGEKPLQSHATYSICEGRILFSIRHQTRCNEVISKRQTAGSSLFSLFLAPPPSCWHFPRVGVADFPFHFAASPGTHLEGAAPKLPPQHRPCRCEKMGHGMKRNRVTHLEAGGNFQFSQRYRIIMLGLWGVNYLQKSSGS